jgi:hypothetical protein
MPARIFPITPATITLGETVEVEMAALVPNVSSVGVIGQFNGNFTKALYLRSHNAAEVERRLGYGHGRLAPGWWLLFALDRPSPDNFEFGGYTHFSGSRVGNPALGSAWVLGSISAISPHRSVAKLRRSFRRAGRIVGITRRAGWLL